MVLVWRVSWLVKLWNRGIIALLRGSDAIDSVVDWTLLILIVLPSGNLTQQDTTMKNQHFNRWIIYQSISAQFVITMSIYWRLSDLFWSRFSADPGSVIARTGMESWWALRPLHAKLEPRFPQVAQFCRSWWLQEAVRQQRFEVRELFKRLPVRHKEFLKNAKSQATCRRQFEQWSRDQPHTTWNFFPVVLVQGRELLRV